MYRYRQLLRRVFYTAISDVRGRCFGNFGRNFKAQQAKDYPAIRDDKYFNLIELYNTLLIALFTVLTTQFIDDLIKPCEAIALTNAKQSVDKGEYHQHLIESQIGSGKNQDLDNDAKVCVSRIYLESEVTE